MRYYHKICRDYRLHLGENQACVLIRGPDVKGGRKGWTEGQKDEYLEIFPYVLQDIDPFGPQQHMLTDADGLTDGQLKPRIQLRIRY